MAVVETHHADHHHDDHHDHGEFIAHHFDSAEQQFDSGKLGIWVFLVTEILFFSGLFVAYTLYRNHHPEIFEQAHVHLDKYLGGLNTVVLLFSSLTMALGVRAAQLGQNKSCGIYTLITMVCAAVFLGVKAVEYSHKWDLGILVRSAFNLGGHREPTTAIGQALHISDYLVYLSVIPAVLLVLFLVGAVLTKMNSMPNFSKLLVGLAITVGGYFLGAVGGQVYQWNSSDGGGHGTHAALQSHGSLASIDQGLLLHAMTQGHDEEHGLESDSGEVAVAKPEKHATDKQAGDDHADHEHGDDHAHHGDDHGASETAEVAVAGGHKRDEKLNRDIGIFFSIYYCMTGLHAIHIIGGIIALAWIYWRSLLGHWRSDYFGPVDYVGLYWHLVDLIWIYLFPLLYLID